jgi:hypothetical protein
LILEASWRCPPGEKNARMALAEMRPEWNNQTLTRLGQTALSANPPYEPGARMAMLIFEPRAARGIGQNGFE